MAERTWDDFLAFLYELPGQIKPGRQGIRVVRDQLQALVDQKVLPQLTDADRETLFPLGFSPSESDLKITAGVGLERGLITSAEYEQALRADKAAGPFSFLQTVSGKAFGETIAPLIARFWLCNDGDEFTKMPTTALYDFGWTPAGREKKIKIELKASTERDPRFQQIRHPWMTDHDANEPEYDLLLCMGASNSGLHWWAFPAQAVAEYIDAAVFAPQHGGQKMESGTYWVVMNANERARHSKFEAASETLRKFVKSLDGNS